MSERNDRTVIFGCTLTERGETVLASTALTVGALLSATIDHLLSVIL